MLLIISAKLYYKWRNHSREKIWSAMTSQEKANYLETTEEKGNKRYFNLAPAFILIFARSLFCTWK